MLPVLREEGLTCLFFVTGASVEASSRMLWYEELYLLLLAAPEGDLALPPSSSPVRLGPSGTRRPFWWHLVRELSKQDPAARSETLDSLRKHSGLSSDWQSVYESDPMRRRYFLLTLAQLRELAAAGMSIGAHTLATQC